MDHEISIRTQAAERYLLGELRPQEREAFEQHFFECQECAEDVCLGFQFGEDARTIFSQQPPRIPTPVHASKRHDWFAWLRPVMLAPIAASLGMVALSGYQNVIQIPALRARVEQLQTPQVLSSILLAPSSRSSLPPVAVSRSAQFIQLSLAIGAIAPSEGYRCDLRSESGKSIATIPVSKLDPDGNLTLLIPTYGLETGSYEAVLVGVSGRIFTDLDHYRFAVHRD